MENKKKDEKSTKRKSISKSNLVSLPPMPNDKSSIKNSREPFKFATWVEL